MELEKVTLSIADGVAVLAFNDPERLNAVGERVRADFSRALDMIEAPGSGARCLLLTGTGRAFCSGANLSEGNRADPDPKRDHGAGLEAWYNPTFLRLRDLDMPIVAAVNGPAAGVGMSFAVSADLVLAARSAYFLQAFTRIGLVPDGGATYVLPRLIGKARAMELSLLAERLPAEKALEWGLINQVHDDDRLMDEAMALARRLASGPTVAMAITRRAYWQSFDNDYAAQLHVERQSQQAAGQTADFREGVTAFLEKRPARFQGR